jgi:hypothetical protein
MVEGACTMLDAEIAADGRSVPEYTARVASLVGLLLETVTRQRLLPYAVAGRKAIDGRRKGGSLAAKARQDRRGLLGWRTKALRLDSMMDDDLSRKERASFIAKRLRDKVSWRTVYDAIPARRPRKSSR